MMNGYDDSVVMGFGLAGGFYLFGYNYCIGRSNHNSQTKIEKSRRKIECCKWQ